MLKFCDALPRWHPLVLDAPLRWSAKDPLERWLTQTLLLEDAYARVIAAEPTLPDTDSGSGWRQGVSTACRRCGIGTHVCWRR